MQGLTLLCVFILAAILAYAVLSGLGQVVWDVNIPSHWRPAVSALIAVALGKIVLGILSFLRRVLRS